MSALTGNLVKYLVNISSCDGLFLFLQIFKTNLDDMVEDLEQGDAAETVRTFFEKSRACPPQTKSTLSIQEVSCIMFISFFGPSINKWVRVKPKVEGSLHQNFVPLFI